MANNRRGARAGLARVMGVTLMGVALMGTTMVPPDGPFAVTGGGRFPTLAAALESMDAGDGEILIDPGVYRQCGVVLGGRVRIAARQPGSVVFDGVACEGKAALVLRGRSATIDGLVFRNIRVPDRNGAGIRLETGDLIVNGTSFRDSEQGLLTADDATGRILLRQSTFSGLGTCPDGMCAHSVYVNGYGRLMVERCRFERGTGGHYLKSRAGHTDVQESTFDDSRGRATNYLIDLPDGAEGTITGNLFIQGAHKDNHSALIAVGAERPSAKANRLTIAGNEARLAQGAVPTVFVAYWATARPRLLVNQLGPDVQNLQGPRN